MRNSLISILSVFLLIILSVYPCQAAEESDRVFFSAITLYHPIVMYQKYQPLMTYLTKNTPYKFELKLSQDYRDIVDFLKSNKVQVALLGGVTYLEAKKEFGVVPIIKPLGPNGKPFYRCAFITKEENEEIKYLIDLKGRSIAFASKLSTSGTLAPLYHLYSKTGIELKDLKKHKNFRYHDSVARQVLRGDFDAGAVIDSVASRFKNRGLRVIDTTDPIPGLPIVVRADASSGFINTLKEALLSLDYNISESRKMMEKWDEEFRYGFTLATDSDYDSIRNMIKYLRMRGLEIP